MNNVCMCMFVKSKGMHIKIVSHLLINSTKISIYCAFNLYFLPFFLTFSESPPSFFPLLLHKVYCVFLFFYWISYVKKLLYWNVINIPYNSPIWSVPFNIFQCIHRVLYPLPQPNFRTFIFSYTFSNKV